MGSSKKHKDREHKHKRKRHHDRDDAVGVDGDRSRSKSKERHSKRKERKVERSDSRYDETITSNIVSSEVQLAGSNIPKSSEGDSSLNIEQTNALRIKLGLKPLDVSGGGEDDKLGETEDVHAPAVNWGHEKRTARLREKMHVQKEKRAVYDKLSKVKTLGESDSDEESTKNWIKKSRKISKEKILAEKRAKMLQEMDEEFGITNLMEQEFKHKNKDYSSKDLKGLKVEHKLDKFFEGNSVILTLKDQGILDEKSDDVLINVNIVDDERAEQNVKVKKKKPDYKPYDEPQFDEYGQLEMKNILDKYDEDIDGNKAKQSFELGSHGDYDASEDRQIDRIRKELKQHGQTLSIPAPVLASEYYTQDEADAKFKKVKKKVRKIRKKTMLKADDLVPLSEEVATEEDYGSRQRGRGWVKQDAIPGLDDDDEEMIDGQEVGFQPVMTKDYGHGLKSENGEELPLSKSQGSLPLKAELPDVDDYEMLGNDEFDGVVVDDTEVENELHSALNKVRRLKQKKEMKFPEKIAEQFAQTIQKTELVDGTGANIILNSTSEFCRNLGEIPTYGLSGNREEKREEIMDTELELLEKERREQEMEEMTGGWNEVDIDIKPVSITGEETAVLEEEPIVAEGVSAALMLASRKGYIENDNKKTMSAPLHSLLAAKHYSIEDKRYDDLDEKFRKRDRYHGGGMTQDFREKEGYNPSVKLEYVDDSGRSMNAKEAFRQLSHRFHGKGSGKKKTEKRQKKVEEENLMKQMSSTDTPLNTLSLLQDKQKAEKSPFVVLTGNKGFSAHTITKA